MALPFFESEGVVTVAALACLTELDIAHHAVVNRLRQGQGSVNITALNQSYLPPPAVVPDPVSASALHGSRYVDNSRG